MDYIVKTLCNMIEASEDKIGAANVMAMVAGNILLGTPMKEKTGLDAKAEYYNKVWGLRVQMDKDLVEELKKEIGFAYPSLDIIPYSRAQAGAVAFVMGHDKDGDLAMLLVRKKGENNHRPPQGYFKPVPPVLGLDEEAKKGYDTDLIDNAKRELKAEVGIDVDEYGVKGQLLGTHGHNENPYGNDMTTIAGCFLFDFTDRDLPKLGKGYDEGDPDPELPFDSVVWVKVKDMKFTEDEITFPEGHITTDKLGRGIRNDMDYTFAIKAIKKVLDDNLFKETGLNAKAIRAQFGRPAEAKIKVGGGADLMAYFKELNSLGGVAKQMIQANLKNIRG